MPYAQCGIALGACICHPAAQGLLAGNAGARFSNVFDDLRTRIQIAIAELPKQGSGTASLPVHLAAASGDDAISGARDAATQAASAHTTREGDGGGGDQAAAATPESVQERDEREKRRELLLRTAAGLKELLQCCRAPGKGD